jgi:hypothetical protein
MAREFLRNGYTIRMSLLRSNVYEVSVLIKSQTEPRTAFGIPRTDLTMMLVVLIWGANFSMVKISLLQMPPLTFATLRFIIATPILWIFMR